MKKIITTAFVASLVLALIGPTVTFAATTPSLGAAANYAVLGSTYTNTSGGTVINGSVGFTTGPAVAPGGVHANYGSGAPYATAGSDQGSALSALASQPCTFTFAPGAINLSTDTTHGAIGMYAPGVYCSSGAMNVGGPLTLSGNGTFIFRPVGALTSTAGASVILAGGASACNVFWTPTQATTLAANTVFAGTVIDDAGVTVGANTTWSGRSLAFGGTVTTDTDTITAPSCSVSSSSASAQATLNVVKVMVNGNLGTGVPSNFTLHVKSAGADVAGSPAPGSGAPGTAFSLSTGTYVVSENVDASYAQSFSGACDSSGSVTLSAGDSKICTVTNTFVSATTTASVSNVNTPAATTTATVTTVVPTNPVTTTTTVVTTPGFPNTGFPPQEKNIPLNVAILVGALLLGLVSFVVVSRKGTV